MIKPTVGRIVYYTPPSDKSFFTDAPLAALITHVWSDSCVNLAIFDPNGALYRPFGEPTTSILLVQEGEAKPTGGHYCEWMPYQVKKNFGSESGEAVAGTKEI